MTGARLIPVVVAVFIGVLPIVPPEHVHESDANGHHERVFHRHAHAHDLDHHAADHDGVFDDDDAPILTVSASFTIPSPSTISVPIVRSGVRIELPAPRVLPTSPGYVEHQIHGPPRATQSLRAPPTAFHA